MRISLHVGLVLATAAHCFAATVQSPQPVQPSTGGEQALRERVKEFYGLLQVGKYSQAEGYLTEDSKENFRYHQRGPFLDYEIQSVKLEADGKSATVQVVMRVFAAQLASTPVPVTKVTHWRLVDGVWYAVIPKPDPNAMKALFASPGAGTKAPPPPPQELKFKGNTYNFAYFPQGTVKEARFPFQNVTDHPVTITDVATGCDCLKAKLQKKQYAPGESGVLAIDFDSSNYKGEYVQTIVVKTDPGDQVTLLNVHGYAIPPTGHAPKAAQGSTGAKKP